MLQLIEVLQEVTNEGERNKIDWLTELYDLLVLVGVLTFGSAQYSTMTLKLGYLISLIYFSSIMILEAIAAFYYNITVLAVIFVVDGLFHGGMLMVFYEMTAELAYPVGESLSLGLLLAIYFGLRNIFIVANDCLVDPKLNDQEEVIREREIINYYIGLYCLFLVASTIAGYFAWRSKPEYVRFEFDALTFEDLEDERREEEQEENQKESADAHS